MRFSGGRPTPIEPLGLCAKSRDGTPGQAFMDAAYDAIE